MLSEEQKLHFLSRIDITENDEDCWEWTGAKNRGYGACTMNKYPYKAHRLAYELLKGKIPEGLHIDHLCRNRACCNPSHLEPVTLAENNRRAKAHLTHCKRGHEFNETNTRLSSVGTKDCLICRRERKASYRRRDGIPERKSKTK